MLQYALPIRLEPDYSLAAFFVTPSNREAYHWVLEWPRWPGNASLLHGPAGSGKTHLGRAWAQRAQASVVNASELPDAALPPGALLLEDIERADARRLLHAFNQASERKDALLMTAGSPAGKLAYDLPDLTSRLHAVPSAGIGRPDDALLAGVLRKQFADRQLKVTDEVIAYLLPRMERSLSRAGSLVARLDEAALAGKKPVSLVLARRLLERVQPA